MSDIVSEVQFKYQGHKWEVGYEVDNCDFSTNWIEDIRFDNIEVTSLRVNGTLHQPYELDSKEKEAIMYEVEIDLENMAEEYQADALRDQEDDRMAAINSDYYNGPRS